MPLTFTQTVAADAAAAQMSHDPGETLEILSELALIFIDADEAEVFANQMAENFSNSIPHQAVGPFLRVIADTLEGI